MVKFDSLAELFAAFGPHAQEALDFISNEANLRKLKAANSALASEPVSSTLVSVERTEGTQIRIAMDNGALLTKDEWTAGEYDKENVLGIAVITPCVQFILGLHQWKERWSEDTGHVITEKHTEAQALQIVSGLEATRALVEAQREEGNTAAKLCWNYNHKGFQWYLPCLLELNAVCANMEEINELLELVGGELLDEDECYWSSTEHFPFSSWYVNFYRGNSYYGSKYGTSVVRPAVAI